MVFFTSLGSIFPVIFIIALGYVLKKRHWFHHTFSENVSKLIMNVSLPASIFVSVFKYLKLEVLENLSNRLIFTFLSVIIGYLVAYLMIKAVKMRDGRRGAFYNAVVNGNTIFIGMPLNIALFGEQSLPYYLMYYITNTISIWTLGYIFLENDPMEVDSKNRKRSGINWKKLLSPALVAFVISFIFLALKVEIPKPIFNTLDYVGEIVTPLALLYIGIVLADAGLHSIRFNKDTVLALIGRFIISSVVMIVLVKLAGHYINITRNDLNTYVIQSATPVFAALPILTNETKGDIGYATNVVTTSTILFIIVVPLLMTILKFL